MTSSHDAGRDLARRREVLLARSARLRDEIADEVQVVRRGAGILDRGVGLVDRGLGLLDRGGWRVRPGVVVPLAVAGGLLLAFAGPRRVLRFAAKALAFWPVVRPLVPRIAAIVAARRASSRPPS